MLSTFPQLFSYALVVPLIFRLTLGVVGVLAAKSRFGKSFKWASVLYFAVSVFIIIGLFTQIAAIVGILLVKFDWWAEKKNAPLVDSQKLSYILLCMILLSLLFSGPGFFAFDLPL